MYLKLIRPLFKCTPSSASQGDAAGSAYYSRVIGCEVHFDPRIGELLGTELDRYYASIVLTELGKINKSSLIKPEGTSLDDFIQEGQKLFFEDCAESIDVDDLAYYLNMRSCLSHFLRTGEWLNVTVIRDSTASSFQHWGTALGFKSDYLKLLNIDGDRWHDVYSIIIDLFLGGGARFRHNQRLTAVLNRKNLKKIIMTVNYNAGVKSCLEVFLATLKSEEVYDQTLDQEYKAFMLEFHAFLTKDLFNELYESQKDEFLGKHEHYLSLGDASINLKYYETRDAKEVVKIKDQRWIFSVRQIQTDISDFKTKRARNANIIQAYDGRLARHLVLTCSVFPVHDSFGTSLFDVHTLMDETNSYFRRYGPGCTYSMFILV
jgi:hypothetical protein